MNTKAGWGCTFKAAFPYTVPVMTGYLVLSAAYGVLMQSKGYGPLWSTMTSALCFSGSMQYAAVILFAGMFDPLAAPIFSITINARYIFCSIGVLNRFAAAGPFKPFLYFALSDESFSLASTLETPDGLDTGHFYFALCPFGTVKIGALQLCSAPQSVKEHSVKLSRNSKIYAAVEKTGKNAVKSRAVPAPCC